MNRTKRDRQVLLGMVIVLCFAAAITAYRAYLAINEVVQ